MDNSDPHLHISPRQGPLPHVLPGTQDSDDADRDLQTVYAEQSERLWRAVFAFAGDREVASDAVGEAFAQCLARGAEVRSPSRWVWRAAFRIAAGELKERKMRSFPLKDQAIDSMDDEASDLLSALAGLSPRQRACVVLRYYVGYRPNEIAGILGSTAATVRVHLSQGRRRLRRIIEEVDGV